VSCVAYLVNHYPKVSHTFIRREILALERLGLPVQRISLRGGLDHHVDPQDKDEQIKTRYVLRHPWQMLLASARCVVMSPGRFGSALKLATRLGRYADKALLVHWIYLAEACLVAGWLRRSGARHLHAHFGTNSATVAMLASLLSGLPFSMTVHGPEEFERARSIGLPEKIRRAAFVVAISSFCRSQLYRWVEHVHWPKVHVVRCGLDASFHSEADSSPCTNATLVCVGRLCEEKGQLLLLQALRRIVDQGAKIRLVLAGDGDLRQVIETQIDELQLRGHVRITGWISGVQVRHEILEARAMVLPSFAEGLPVVIMEAMALRRPVISTYIAGIPELVCDGDTGWLVPAGDVEVLADCMLDCLAATPERLRAMGDAAYQRVLAQHDVDVEARRLAALCLGEPATRTGVGVRPGSRQTQP